MIGYTLKFAAPEKSDDCLAERLLSFLQSPPWVAYLVFGDLYVSDVNDDPDLEKQYEAGLNLWAAAVRITYAALCRWSGGIPVMISASRHAGLVEFANNLTGKSAEDRWLVQSNPLIDPELVESMATYAWEATMWTALPEGEASVLSRGSLTTAELEQLVRAGHVPWWLSHGYKEPFLTGHTPTLTMAAVADLVRKDVGIPVSVTEDLFVPHRVRMHRRWMA